MSEKGPDILGLREFPPGIKLSRLVGFEGLDLIRGRILAQTCTLVVIVLSSPGGFEESDDNSDDEKDDDDDDDGGTPLLLFPTSSLTDAGLVPSTLFIVLDLFPVSFQSFLYHWLHSLLGAFGRYECLNAFGSCDGLKTTRWLHCLFSYFLVYVCGHRSASISN